MICPVCKAQNSTDSLACSHCGADLGAQTLPHSTQASNVPGRVSAIGGWQAAAAITAPIRLDLLQPGQMLGSRYRIEAEAGQGGMGRVYRATDLELNRTVALKVIRTELADDAVTIARLKEEIRLASEISHPHVLRIHDLGEADGIRFISMAWVEGEDLAHYLSHRGRLDEAEILRIGQQASEGLGAAHAQQIVHRDLKPQNILIAASGNVCIGDFGLAQSLAPDASSHLTQTGHIIGTPRYMSPEQLSGKAVDRRTDIYSLGLVLYEMATGTTPELPRRVFERPVNPKGANPAISDKLAGTILRCLEPEPDKRYASVDELLQSLREPHGAAETPRAKWRSPWAYAAAAVLVIAIAIAITLARRATPIPPLSKGKFIAVLPLAAAGSDLNLKSYSQGITDAVSARLFALDGVHPISQAAIERSDLKQPLDRIARQLGANMVAAGTVEARDGKIIVHSTVSSIEPRKTLSDQTFTGSAESLLEIEDKIYGQISGAAGAHGTGKQLLASVSANPTRNPEAYDLYLQGRELLKETRDAEGAARALQFFEQACAKDPSFALAWTGVADASLQIYRTKRESFWAAKALDAARRAASDVYDLPEVHFTLGSVYTATGKNGEAIEELKRALALEPNSDSGYLRLGRAYLAAGQAEAALGALRKAVELNPYYWWNHDQLGLAFFRMGRNQEALKAFKTAAELNPNNGAEYNRIGAAYWRMGRLQDSIEQFKKVIKLQPSADAYTNLGTAYFALGHYREAIPNFKKAAQINNKNVLYIANLADAYRQAGQQEEASKTYGEAVRLAYQQLQVNPQDSGTMGHLAMCYAKQGDLEKAGELIAGARAIDAADNQLMYDEAVIKTLGGKPQEALAALRQAFEKGYSVEEAKTDSDLKTLRASPDFQKLLESFAGQAERRQ
ncbi:MAG: tetratricopeptide repeat protein [Acidobacteriaceae bacterium]|nr:tetratricopeptide repeat protein [Acidobacteriaceae bacterium]